MSTIGRRAFLRGAAAGTTAAGILGAPALLRAQGTVMRLGTVVTPPHPVVDVLNAFKRDVERETGNAITVQIFHSSQLGGEREMAEALRLGSLEACAITLAAVSTWVPQGGVFDLPFIFRSDDHALRVYSGPVGQKLAGVYPAQGFRVLGFTLSGVRNLFSTFPIEKPEDVRGRKMRTLQSPLHLAIWSRMGANPTPIPHPEVYSALQTKVVEIADNTGTNYVNERWFEVAPFYSTTGHIYAISATYASERWFQRQRPEHRDVLLKAMAAQVPIQQRTILDNDAKSLEKAAAAGARIIRIADKKPWSEPLHPILEQWIGGNAAHRELVEAIVATS